LQEPVNVNVAGTYIITYNVKDAANAAIKLQELLSLLQLGGGAVLLTEFAVNGDFETGNTSGWTTFVECSWCFIQQ
jgi:hypothetical protein